MIKKKKDYNGGSPFNQLSVVSEGATLHSKLLELIVVCNSQQFHSEVIWNEEKLHCLHHGSAMKHDVPMPCLSLLYVEAHPSWINH